MTRFIATIAAGLMLLSAQKAAGQDLQTAARIPDDRAMGELIEARIADRSGAGLVIGVVEPGRPRLVARGPVTGRPFDEHTIFEIGSISKVFTALLLADMALRGEVSLDDPAEKYLPAGASIPERGRKITLKDLAMHVSGLPALPDNIPADGDYTERHLLDFLASCELARDVGSQYEYSNAGAALLGYLLGRAAGTDYETLLRQRITGPLAMNDTAITLSAEQQERFARGHDTSMQPARPANLTIMAPAGGIRSTPADMRKFLAAVLDPGSTLGPAMDLALAHRHRVLRRMDAALGWTILKPPSGEIVLHDGLTFGFSTSMAVDRQKHLGVVGMSNVADEPSINNLVLHLLAGAPLAPVGPVPGAPAPVP